MEIPKRRRQSAGSRLLGRGSMTGRPEWLCDNPQKTNSTMRFVRDLAIGFYAMALAGTLAWPLAQPSPLPKAQVSPVSGVPNILVLSGGTVVDVTQWGHSASDLQDAVVIVRD